MASSNKGIWLVVVLGAAAGLGFAIYYLTVLGPANERREMAQQIEEWAEKKWEPARSCLVGAEPKASTGYDAVVLRSAIPGDTPPVEGECRAFFLDLRRPGEVSSGNDTVEADWKDVEESVGMLANAYAAYDPGEQDNREALGVALDRVDAAYARLRADAKLGASSANASPLPPIAEPHSTTVSIDGTPVEADGIDLFGNALAVHGDASGTPVIALVRGPGDVRAHYMAADARPAAAEARWGVWSTTPTDGPVQLRAGDLTEDGAPATEGVQVVRAQSTAHLPTAIFALGEEKERLILYEVFDDRLATDDSSGQRDPRSYWVARSHDGGATWPTHTSLPITTTPTIYPDWVNRRVDLAWTEPSGEVKWIGIDAEDLSQQPTTRVVFAAPAANATSRDDNRRDYAVLQQCVAPTSEWWVAVGAGDATPVAWTSMDPATPAQTTSSNDPISTILACDDRRLLGSSQADDGVALTLCELTGCKVAFRVPVAGDAQFAATLAPTAGPVATTLTNDLLVLWPNAAPGSKQRVFRTTDIDLSAGDYLRALVDWEGRLHAVVAAGGQVRILALPL